MSADAHLTLPFEELQAGGPSGPVARTFCSQLHQRGYSLLRLPPSAAPVLNAMRCTAASFFRLPPEEKTAIGDFRSIGSTYAGYRNSEACHTEFLEVHMAQTGGTFPNPAAPADFGVVAAALYNQLWRIGRLLLSAIAAHIDVADEALLLPLDPPDAATLPQGGLSSSVLRVCHYHGAHLTADADGSGGEEVAGGSGWPNQHECDVLFEEHTDSSMLTLSPLCTSCPGLQLRDASVGTNGTGGEPWVSVETLPGVTPLDIEVHVGDFLAFLSRDYFPACMHRVLQPSGRLGRLSMPLLMRLRPDHELDTRPYDAERQNPRLVEVHGVLSRDLGRLFDARGKRLLDAHRASVAADADRQARGRAYREAVLAGRPLTPDSDSADS